MLLAGIVETSERIAATSRRLAKIEAIAGLLRQLHRDEIEIAVGYLSGEPRQGRIGAGYRMIQDARPEPAAVPALSIADTDAAVTEVAGTRGTRAKAERLRALMASATAAEQHFLARLLVGELRQGALEGIMADAVAQASGVPAERVRRAVMLAGNIAVVAQVAIEQGEAGLAGYDIQLFRPVQPMLAQTAEDVEEALRELGDTALEFKMDGARVQVHRLGGEVRVYSRSLNDVTAAVPEVVEAALAMPAREFILDGEVLALQPDGRPQPFQITMRRFGRKLDVDRLRTALPLAPFFFDSMYLDGGALIDESQERRFALLNCSVPPGQVMPNLRTADPASAAAFVRESLERGHEGVMAKSATSPYAAGSRGQSWLKVKQARTLDLVILAAEWGSGRRKGWLSNLHLGARDPVKRGFAMLGKTFKGLTDEMLAWQTQELLKLEISRDSYAVYVEPKLVAEIAFNEIQVSPRYVSGLALRFARVKRYRPDKAAADADTFQTVQAMAETAKA
jgi:DNA ligase-1